MNSTRTAILGTSKPDSKLPLRLYIILQHGKDFAEDLIDLHTYTTPVVLEPGDILFQCHGGLIDDEERGLFFIESGMMKIERDSASTLTLTRRSVHSLFPRIGSSSTLNQMHARLGTVGKQSAQLKTSLLEPTNQKFRLARIGPGW